MGKRQDPTVVIRSSYGQGHGHKCPMCRDVFDCDDTGCKLDDVCFDEDGLYLGRYITCECCAKELDECTERTGFMVPINEFMDIKR